MLANRHAREDPGLELVRRRLLSSRNPPDSDSAVAGPEPICAHANNGGSSQVVALTCFLRLGKEKKKE